MDVTRKRKTSDTASQCPYLDTIERSVLDFDFEPACSISLEKGPHIYACLVCGLYFRGRGPKTPAYTHSVEHSHYCYLHLANGTFHCLPDDYEIIDSSLDDIRLALHPTFSQQDVAQIDSSSALSRDLFGRRYLPGFCGLNNLHKTDCLNAICQALTHVQPLRDYFLRRKHGDVLVKKVSASNSKAHAVAQSFGDLVRKVWSNKKFKSSIDPHQLVQALAAASPKFQVGTQMEVGELMSIVLHNLHIGTGGGRKPGSSLVQRIFQGQVRVTTRQTKVKEVKRAEVLDDRAGSGDEEEGDVEMKKEGKDEEESEIEEIETNGHFLQLSLDIPEKPLFRDSDGGLVIPQEPLQNVLSKFDGMTFSDAISRSGALQQKRYRLTKLPNYLILHLQRFRSNQYTKTKNPTIVMFPVKNLDLGDYVPKQETPSMDDVKAMSVSCILAVSLSK